MASLVINTIEFFFFAEKGIKEYVGENKGRQHANGQCGAISLFTCCMVAVISLVTLNPEHKQHSTLVLTGALTYLQELSTYFLFIYSIL